MYSCFILVKFSFSEKTTKFRSYLCSQNFITTNYLDIRYSYFHNHKICFQSQGCCKGQKSGGAGSNVARRRCPAAPSDLPKSGGAAAPPPRPPTLLPV